MSADGLSCSVSFEYGQLRSNDSEESVSLEKGDESQNCYFLGESGLKPFPHQIPPVFDGPTVFNDTATYYDRALAYIAAGDE